MEVLSEKKMNKKKSNINHEVGILNEKDMIQGNYQKEKKKKIISSFADISPIIDVTDNDFFEMRNGEYMEIVQITSKDIYALNENDKDMDVFSLAYLYQAYISDIKIMPLYTPVNLEMQKNKIIKHIRNSKKEQYIPFLEKKLAELEFIEEHRTNKEYFFFLYADTPKALSDKKMHIKKLLTQSNPMIELTLDKKINVLFQLSNLNTKPKVD